MVERYVYKLSQICLAKTHDMLLLMHGLTVKAYQQKCILKQKLFLERKTSTSKLRLHVKCHGVISDENIRRNYCLHLREEFPETFQDRLPEKQNNGTGLLSNSARLFTKLF